MKKVGDISPYINKVGDIILSTRTISLVNFPIFLKHLIINRCGCANLKKIISQGFRI
jgi:hypothetical protein